MNTLRQRTAPIREKRNGSIAAYSGTLQALLREADAGPLVQRVRTFTHDHASDLQRALQLLRSIRGLGLVVHGPAGCAAALHGRLADGGEGAPWAVTAITQRDSILGGDAALRRAIRELHASQRPAAIAVVASPVVAINNDDIETVAAELRDELGVPIFPVLTDGFRSKLGGTGADVAVHALLKHLLPARPRTPRAHVNLLGSGLGDADRRALQALLAEIGLDAQLFPQGAALTEFEQVASARLSVSLDGDEADPTGLALQAQSGVPLLAPPPPLGHAGTTRWLAAIGQATGHAAQAALVASCHAHRLQGSLAPLAAHAGVRVAVKLPAPLALGVVELLTELGLQPAALLLPALATPDLPALRQLAEHGLQLQLLVGEGQAFEEANLLRRLQPGLLIGQGESQVQALRLGIPTLDLQSLPVHGYAGAEAVARAIAQRLAQPSLARFLGGGADRPERRYTLSWLTRSTHWYIKHEVK